MSNLHILFDGPPGPEAGMFVEVENDLGESIRVGEWRERDCGYWELVIPNQDATITSLREEIASLDAERRRDALDWQAVLDEANKEIATLKAEVVEADKRTQLARYSEDAEMKARINLTRECAALRSRAESAEEKVNEANKLLAETQYKTLQIAEERDSFRTQAEAAENKLEKIKEKVDEVMDMYPDLDDDRPYLGDVFDELRQIFSTDVK